MTTRAWVPTNLHDVTIRSPMTRSSAGAVEMAQAREGRHRRRYGRGVLPEMW
jgi:hypothetical protein